ncbi:acyl-CoA dehydrogenase family protein, partial [Streptomyces albus]|uniref:acyl-CoA dehydrogenase family protein n=1 Tax=Streptomyces albus TaxID=1888 RepID=UPI0024E116B4
MSLFPAVYPNRDRRAGCRTWISSSPRTRKPSGSRTRTGGAVFPRHRLDREQDEAGSFPQAFYEAFAEGGWLGMAVPEEYGGGGLGILEASLLLEEVAASGAGMNGCSTMHLTIFGLNTLVKHGSERR